MGVTGSGKSTLGRGWHAPWAGGSWRAIPCIPPPTSPGWPPAFALTDADRIPFLDNVAHAIATRHEQPGDSCSALKRAYRDVLRQADPQLLFVLPSSVPRSAAAAFAAAQPAFHAGCAARQPACGSGTAAGGRTRSSQIDGGAAAGAAGRRSACGIEPSRTLRYDALPWTLSPTYTASAATLARTLKAMSDIVGAAAVFATDEDRDAYSDRFPDRSASAPAVRRRRPDQRRAGPGAGADRRRAPRAASGPSAAARTSATARPRRSLPARSSSICRA